MLKPLILFGTLFSLQLLGLCHEIALTFDDFPKGSSNIYEKRQRVKIYAEKLEKLNIQAAFFCIGEQLIAPDADDCLPLIASNHFLANHSFCHLHLSKSSLMEFEEEIYKTEQLLIGQENFRKWFRFPYLDYGDRSSLGGSDRKRCAAFLFLHKNGYQHAYITIPTLDWYVDAEMRKALEASRNINWVNLRNAYLALLENWIDAYHSRWSHVIKKPFVHVLLLHQNDLNAIFLKDIVDLIHQKKWKIVSPELAFRHPIPYLSKFVNSKKSILRGVSTLNKDYIDRILAEHAVFKKKE